MTDETNPTAYSPGSKNEAEPPKRELEQAPLLLRKASRILIVGALFPWMTSISTQGHMPWGYWFGAVIMTLMAGGVLYEGANAKAGAKANGLVKKVSDMHPMAVPGLSVLLFVLAAVIAFSGSVYFSKTGHHFLGFSIAEGAEDYRDTYSLRAVLEHGTLYLALATFAHIHNYEYGGKFNPIFPLMFLGPAVAGAMHVLTAAADIGLCRTLFQPDIAHSREVRLRNRDYSRKRPPAARAPSRPDRWPAYSQRACGL